MRCFAIKPGRSETLDPVNPEAARPTHLVPIEIILGNTIKKSIYFAIELINNKYYITAVSKALHDETNPLAEMRQTETDIV